MIPLQQLIKSDANIIVSGLDRLERETLVERIDHVLTQENRTDFSVLGEIKNISSYNKVTDQINKGQKTVSSLKAGDASSVLHCCAILTGLQDRNIKTYEQQKTHARRLIDIIIQLDGDSDDDTIVHITDVLIIDKQSITSLFKHKPNSQKQNHLASY